MNELGRMLVWSTAQVTLLAALAAAVYAVFSRRRPATAVQVSAAGLAGCVALTLTAFCPLPGWWTWLGVQRTEPIAVRPAPVQENAEPGSIRGGVPREEGAGGGFFWPVLPDLSKRTGLMETGRAEIGVSGMAVFAAVFLTGTVLGLGRLLAGLWLVSRCRRSSQPIDDPEINGLADSLRAAFDCRRVSLRECAGLTGPATAGWLRPVLLLPAAWREWDGEERRAVLAHEMAHVRRGDFAARVVAGLGVALHLYHPLLHWLSGRLRLQQELAADALAAPLAGGRECYLRALARLALRLDGPAPAWPAHAFLSSPRTLMRRVQMLRSTDGSTERRAARGFLTVFLVAGVVAASALRSPAREGAADAPAAAKPKSADSANHKPDDPGFDLTYVSPSARGVLVYRPSVLFSSPAMRKVVAKFDQELEPFARVLGLKGLPLKLEEIDEIVGELVFVRPKDENGPASLMVALRSVRAVKNFDWLNLVRQLAPGTTESKKEGKPVYTIPPKAIPLLGGNTAFTIPDARTIAFLASTEKVASAVSHPADAAGHADVRPEPSAAPASAAPRQRLTWRDEWKMIRGDAIIFAVDLRGLDWALARLRKDKSVDPALVGLLENAESFALGIDTKDGLRFEAWCSGKDKESPAKIQEFATSVLTRLAADPRNSGKDSGGKQQGGPMARLLSQLAEHSEWVDWNLTDLENVVNWRCKPEMTLEEWSPLLVP
jgi:beta-lactamase regulating signal transducer with metallopeptidase domain